MRLMLNSLLLAHLMKSYKIEAKEWVNKRLEGRNRRGTVHKIKCRKELTAPNRFVERETKERTYSWKSRAKIRGMCKLFQR